MKGATKATMTGVMSLWIQRKSLIREGSRPLLNNPIAAPEPSTSSAKKIHRKRSTGAIRQGMREKGQGAGVVVQHPETLRASILHRSHTRSSVEALATGQAMSLIPLAVEIAQGGDIAWPASSLPRICR